MWIFSKGSGNLTFKSHIAKIWKEWVTDEWGESRQFECHGSQGHRELP